MVMPPASKERMTEMLIATIKGTVNACPRKLKFMFKGDASKVANGLVGEPTVTCHHGVNREAAINKNVEVPPATPNQFIFLVLFLL